MYNNDDSWGCFTVIVIIIIIISLITTVKNVFKPDDIQSIEQLSQIINIDELELGIPIKAKSWFISTKRPKEIKMGKHKYTFKYAKFDCVYTLPKKPEQPYDTILYIDTKKYKISGNKDLYTTINALLIEKKKAVKGQITLIVFIKKWSILPNELSFYTDYKVE